MVWNHHLSHNVETLAGSNNLRVVMGVCQVL